MEQDLKVQFGTIEQAPETLPDEQGRVQVTITNDGNEILTNGSLDLFASTDRELDLDNLNTNEDRIEGTDLNLLKGTDELLGTLEGINLAAGESQTLTIDFATEEFTNPSVVSPGAYTLMAQVDPDNAIIETDENNNQAIESISVDGTDAILDWNSVFLNASQTQGKLDAINGVKLTDDTVPGEAPPGVTRTFDGFGDLNSFQEAALENADSRVYGGVHLNSSVQDGLATGQDIGAYVAENFLTA